jgi:MGT family glycosyltransferase
MSRFVICAQPLAGHVGPALPIAAELVARGHDVRFYTGAKYRERVTATGARFVGFNPAHDFDDTNLDVTFPERARLRGLAQFRWDITNVFLNPVPAHVADLEKALAEEPADVLVCDPSFIAGYVMHRRHAVRWATFSITVLTTSDPLVPPFGLGLRYNPGPLGVARNKVVGTLTRTVVLRSLQTTFERVMREVKVPADGQWVFDAALSPYLFLQPSVPALEYPRRHWPRQLHFIGALLPAPAHPRPPDWWGDLDAADRVVLVTQGTAQTDPEHLVVPAIRAFADEPGTLVVATLPSHRPEELSVRPLPGNARVASFVPFDAIMPHVDVMVTNGGFGGVHFALRAGVPLVVAGSTEDKPEVARRVEYAGVGVNLATGRPTPQQVRAGVDRVRDDPAYRRAAEAVSADLSAADGPNRAADLLIQLALTRDAVVREPSAPLPAAVPDRG